MVVHATEAELTAYPVTVPAGASAALLLKRASRDVDRALLCAVYDVEDGVATDADVLAALRDATIEQVAGMIEAGDLTGTGAAAPVSGVTIGRVSVQRQLPGGGATTATRVGPLYPQAWAVLQQAGLTGQGPITC